MHRIPFTSLADNLMWTNHGVIWAMWRLSPLAYGYGKDESKMLVKAVHQAMFQSLTGESLLLGFSANLDPAVVIEKMMDGVPMDRCPEYLTEVELNLLELENSPVGTRAFWLAAPIADLGIKQTIATRLHAADATLRNQLALPRRVPGHKEIAHALAAAQQIENAIPREFHAQPATPEELNWINDHMQRRGLSLDVAVPEPKPAEKSARIVSGSLLSEPWIDEGGQSDQASTATRLMPFKRRYLKVGHVESETDSYQVLLAMTGTPQGGFVFPGVEFIKTIDDLPVDADFGIRMTIQKAERAKQRNARAESTLNDQYDQQSGQSNPITGSTNDLDDIARILGGYQASLNQSESEVEVQATTIIAVGADNPGDAKAKAKFITDFYKRKEFKFEAPLGGQEELWWAMLPGIPASRLVNELAQITTGREFAMGVPVVSNAVGEANGFLLGYNISSGRRSPVLMNIGGNMERDISGSFGATGENGSGKSTFLKTVAGHTFDRDGLLVVIDRSDNQEWATFARSLNQDRTSVVDLMEPRYSLDPLRMFGPRIGSRMVKSLFAVLFGIETMSDDGSIVGSILDPQYTVQHGLTSLLKLMAHMQGSTGIPAGNKDVCRRMARRLNNISSIDLGEVLFNEDLPVLSMDSQAVVFCTHGLDMPSKDELFNESLKKEMSLEKIFGRAMYALLAGIGKTICFADDSREALMIVDECHHMTGSPEGERELVDFIRYGRKHKAALGLGSHDATHDFGSEVLRGLIPQRFVFRNRDEQLARNNLKWFASMDTDEWVETVTKHLSPQGAAGVPLERRGECLMRDAQNRIATIKVQVPRESHRAKAVLTTPPKVSRREELVS
jgi:energy-coupling factor transporter ATP-binding protein EcfA2